jgi:hypothetical protein
LRVFWTKYYPTCPCNSRVLIYKSETPRKTSRHSRPSLDSGIGTSTGHTIAAETRPQFLKLCFCCCFVWRCLWDDAPKAWGVRKTRTNYWILLGGNSALLLARTLRHMYTNENFSRNNTVSGRRVIHARLGILSSLLMTKVIHSWMDKRFMGREWLWELLTRKKANLKVVTSEDWR